MDENILIFFLTWTALGVIYFLIKTFECHIAYENENKLGKTLTIFLGGPGVWLVKSAFFICWILRQEIKPLNKNERDK